MGVTNSRRHFSYRIPIEVKEEDISLIGNMMKRSLVRMTAPKVLRAHHSTHAIVEVPLADFLRDLEGRLAQAQIASDKRLIESQALQKIDLAQAQVASENYQDIKKSTRSNVSTN